MKHLTSKNCLFPPAAWLLFAAVRLTVSVPSRVQAADEPTAVLVDTPAGALAFSTDGT